MLQSLSRRGQKTAGAILPNFWKEDVLNVLNETYGDRAKAENMQIYAWGEAFENELLVIVSMADEKNPARIPLTFFLSADVNPQLEQKAVLKTMVDALGVRFDDYFAQEWMDHHDAWQEITVGKFDFYTKANRENVELTLKANQILSAAGINPEDGEEYDDR